ncbi:S1C family serine protease [Flammeovirga agarivorans]|uniref:Serine protease n=1 Tax=Flammeovirga agarivorans TaxID=2726742 RepID=A0A7X8SGL3_9BACT|nr:S1C family serine protease [Flammeovirga agarivorans]NLR89889.1 serine protease [Flammeovirga agarivorans]
MYKIIITLLITSFLFSGCATILNGKYQRVRIQTDKGATILVNGEEPKIKNGKVHVSRSKTPHQLTVTKEGYQDENRVLIGYKRHPLYYLSWAFVFYILPPALDNGDKAFNFDKSYSVTKMKRELYEKGSELKDVRLNKVSVDLDKSVQNQKLFIKYRNYLKGVESNYYDKYYEKEDIDVENTVFSDILNVTLHDKGFINKENKALNNSYLNNAYLNANLVAMETEHVKSHYGSNVDFITVKFKIEWEILDYYKKPIYKRTISTKSDQFVVGKVVDSPSETGSFKAINTTIEKSLVQFMNLKEVKEHLKVTTDIKEESFASLPIPSAPKYVSNMNQAVDASVTIKNENGHGSGFIISENGYIITNYHVISDSGKDYEVVLNDGRSFKHEIIRVDRVNDLALIKIEAKDLVPFKVSNTKEHTIAQEVYVIGTPTADDLNSTVSKGIISGIRENKSGQTLLQTDASINGGNSGGVICTKQGMVLGVVSSKLSGLGIEGVAFGIPSHLIHEKLHLDFVEVDN